MTTQKKISIIGLTLLIIYLVVSLIYIQIQYRKLWRRLNVQPVSNTEKPINLGTVIYKDNKYNVVLSYDKNTINVDFLPTGNHVTRMQLFGGGSVLIVDNYQLKIHALSETFTQEPYSQATLEICRAKEEVDNGKAIVGCLATVGGAICILSAPETGATSVAVCTDVIDYAIDAGFADCLDKFEDIIAEKTVGTKAYNSVGATKALSAKEIKEGLSKALNAVCADIIKEDKKREAAAKAKESKSANVPNPQPTPTPNSVPSQGTSTGGHPDHDNIPQDHSTAQPDTKPNDGGNDKTSGGDANGPRLSPDDHIDRPENGNGGMEHSDPGTLGFVIGASSDSLLPWVLPVIAGFIAMGLLFFLLIYKRR